LQVQCPTSYLPLCVSITKRYNLVLAKGMISLPGKVILVKVMGIYHLAYDYCHLRADCQETGISYMHNACN